MVNPEGESKANNAEGEGHAESCSVDQTRWPDYVVNFLNLVKKTYEKEPETYRNFLRTLGDFKNRRISADYLIVRVHLLFKEHKELLNEFSQFLPKQYTTTDGFDFDDAVALVKKIKFRFLDDKKVFEAFLETLHKYKNGTYDVADTFRAVCELFKDHPDLILEYRKCLPPVILQPIVRADPYASVADSGSTRMEDAADYLQKVKEKFGEQPETYKDLLAILKDYKHHRIDVTSAVAEVKDLFEGDHELIMGFNTFLPIECQLDKRMILKYDRATAIINTSKSRFRHDLFKARPFITAFHWYSLDTMSFEDFYNEIMEHLENYPDLLDELRAPILMAFLSVPRQVFLPHTYDSGEEPTSGCA